MANSQTGATFVDDGGETRLSGTLYTAPIQTSGALSTVSVSSGTGTTVSATRTVDVAVPITYDGTANIGTAKFELAPDGASGTYSTLFTDSLAAAVNGTGAITLAHSVKVPAGWGLKVTVVHASIGTCTYW